VFVFALGGGAPLRETAAVVRSNRSSSRAMDLTVGVVVYCLLVLLFFLGIWLYYDRRDKALYDAERRKITFRCVRCDRLYTTKGGTETAVCPRCGYTNTRLKF
jgi:hypothetical protein